LVPSKLAMEKQTETGPSQDASLFPHLSDAEEGSKPDLSMAMKVCLRNLVIHTKDQTLGRGRFEWK